MRFTIAAVVVGALACGAVARAGEEIRQRDLVYTPAGDPHLRINVHGHTGSVRAVAFTPDSNRLCTAGWDKVIQVWNLRAVVRDLQGAFLKERTLRWQVARGPLGNINAAAIAPSDGLLAFGGHSAMGELGEILLVDPVQGTLQRVLEGHRQAIGALAFSTDGNWLASTDTDGHSIVWKRGDWKPVTLYEVDEKTYGVPRARRIRAEVKVRPLVIAGNRYVVLPVCTGEEADGRLIWKLRRVSLANPADTQTYETAHHRMVSALAVTPDGARLASSDLAGKLHLWNLADGAAQPLDPKATVSALAFSPDGRTLCVGTMHSAGSGTGQMQVWNVEPPTFLRRQIVADHVLACAVSPDGKQVAYTGGKDFEVFVEPLRDGGRQISLGGKGRRVLKVAFAKEPPFYRIAFGSRLNERGFNEYGDLEASFDAQRLELSPVPLKPADWLDADGWRGDWRASWQQGALELSENGQPRGKVVLASELVEGAPRCYCWIPDRQGNPFALAVGTDLQNSIYVVRLADRALLRHFRGHSDAVLSLAVSRDLRYLASGSADGTVGIWSLADCEQGPTLYGRWGADLTLVKAGTAPPATRDLARKDFLREDRLVVSRIQPAGPLYHKGVREGDVITEIRWFAEAEGQKEFRAARPEEILERLRQMPWGALVEFRTARGDAPRPVFVLRPAWQPLSTLFVSADREWAYWTPEGYYEASVNGHTLFGWQVNRGMRSLAAFYRADQFHQRLEQPSVLEQLLPTGSLHDAFERANLQPQGELHRAVPDQIAAAPVIEIVQPGFDAEVQGNVAQVRARVQVPLASKVADARIYANGVVGTERKLIAEVKREGFVEQTYEWRVTLPTEEVNLIQVVVGTSAQVTALGDIRVRRINPVRPARPKMYVLGVGIDQYADPRVPQLDFSADDARAVRDVLQTRSSPLYDVVAAPLLINADVTPEKWRKALEDLTRQLIGRVGPDDLLVLFLAGHGLEDVRTKQYYFVGHNFKMSDRGKSYAGCITWNDFRILADVPCRKLALIDTCHSGAIQPPRARNTKAAVRQLQDDVIFTVTASQGDQPAAESPTRKHGVFTVCLLDALEGKAISAGQTEITLNDVVRYVQQAVPRLTAELTGGDGQQHPTAAPDGVLEYARIPLTRGQETRQTSRQAPDTDAAVVQRTRP